VSDKFPTYRLYQDRADINYVEWFFKTEHVANQAQRLSKGAAAISKLTLNPPQFWELEIPLPPLAEQRRTAAKIQRLVAKIDEAREEGQLSYQEGAALLGSGLNRLAELFPERSPLGTCLTGKPRNGWSARCDSAPDGVPVLGLSAVTGFKYRDTEFKRTSLQTDPDADYWLRPGDLCKRRRKNPSPVAVG
jgi:type I restriction enzyme S subunit